MTRKSKNLNYMDKEGLGMAMGWDGDKGWGLRPYPAWFCLAPSPPRPA